MSLSIIQDQFNDAVGAVFSEYGDTIRGPNVFSYHLHLKLQNSAIEADSSNWNNFKYYAEQDRNDVVLLCDNQNTSILINIQANKNFENEEVLPYKLKQLKQSSQSGFVIVVYDWFPALGHLEIHSKIFYNVMEEGIQVSKCLKNDIMCAYNQNIILNSKDALHPRDDAEKFIENELVDCVQHVIDQFGTAKEWCSQENDDCLQGEELQQQNEAFYEKKIAGFMRKRFYRSRNNQWCIMTQKYFPLINKLLNGKEMAFVGAYKFDILLFQSNTENAQWVCDNHVKSMNGANMFAKDDKLGTFKEWMLAENYRLLPETMDVQNLIVIELKFKDSNTAATLSQTASYMLHLASLFKNSVSGCVINIHEQGADFIWLKTSVDENGYQIFNYWKSQSLITNYWSEFDRCEDKKEEENSKKIYDKNDVNPSKDAEMHKQMWEDYESRRMDVDATRNQATITTVKADLAKSGKTFINELFQTQNCDDLVSNLGLSKYSMFKLASLTPRQKWILLFYATSREMGDVFLEAGRTQPKYQRRSITTEDTFCFLQLILNSTSSEEGYKAKLFNYIKQALSPYWTKVNSTTVALASNENISTSLSVSASIDQQNQIQEIKGEDGREVKGENGREVKESKEQKLTNLDLKEMRAVIKANTRTQPILSALQAHNSRANQDKPDLDLHEALLLYYYSNSPDKIAIIDKLITKYGAKRIFLSHISNTKFQSLLLLVKECNLSVQEDELFIQIIKDLQLAELDKTVTKEDMIKAKSELDKMQQKLDTDMKDKKKDLGQNYPGGNVKQGKRPFPRSIFNVPFEPKRRRLPNGDAKQVLGSLTQLVQDGLAMERKDSFNSWTLAQDQILIDHFILDQPPELEVQNLRDMSANFLQSTNRQQCRTAYSIACRLQVTYGLEVHPETLRILLAERPA